MVIRSFKALTCSRERCRPLERKQQPLITVSNLEPTINSLSARLKRQEHRFERVTRNVGPWQMKIGHVAVFETYKAGAADMYSFLEHNAIDDDC